MRLVRPWLLVLPLLVACFDKGSDDDDDDDDDGSGRDTAVDEPAPDTDVDTDAGTDTDTDTDTDADTDAGTDTDADTDTESCPDSVPADYRHVWDCVAATCDGPMLYRYGVGSSSGDGALDVTEQWFVFRGPDAWCVDTFTITGTASPIDPTTFNCSQCEEIYETRWAHSGTDCGVPWGGLLFGSAGADEAAPYDGYLMFDTHTGFGDRNADNAARVERAMVLGGVSYPDADHASGTATPTGTTDGPPEDYAYASAGACLEQ